MRTPLIAVTLVLCLLPAAVSAQVPRGPEFQVNTYTTQQQTAPFVASNAGGNFVVTWQSIQQDGDREGVFARGYDASGDPVGPAEFRLNSHTTGAQLDPSVAAAPDGSLAFFWNGHGPDGSGFDVYGRRFDFAGAPVGGDFRVNSHTTSYQHFSSVGVDAAGRLVVAWESAFQDGSERGVFGQRFEADGTPQGPEFGVNSFTTANQRAPAVGMAADGSFVVVWQSAGSLSGGQYAVFAQRFASGGSAVGPEFRVNVDTLVDQHAPAVASDADGNFVVVWQTSILSPGLGDVMARRFDASGYPLTSEFRVNTYTTSYQGSPALASDPAGNFVVAWEGVGPGDTSGVFARRFDLAGGATADFRVHSTTSGSQAQASVASDAQGNFVVAWQSMASGSHADIFARRFRPEWIFGDDFESGNLSAWSASATDGGDLIVSSAAALNFTSAGLLGTVDDTAALFVEDHTPDDELRYRVRFHLDPNGFDPGELENHRRTRVFTAFTEAPTRRVAAIVLRRLSGTYAIMGRARLDDNVQADTGFFTISDGPHVVEFDLKPASDADAEDGSFELRIDGVPQTVLTGLDNSLARVDLGRLGALSVKTGANGTIYWDEFESWRTAFPGP